MMSLLLLLLALALGLALQVSGVAAVAGGGAGCLSSAEEGDLSLVFRFRGKPRAAAVANAFPQSVLRASTEGVDRALVQLREGVNATLFTQLVCRDPTFASQVIWIVPLPQARLHILEKVPDVYGTVLYESGLLPAPSAGALLMVTDTGVDPGHCAFYDPGHPTLSEATLYSAPLSSLPADSGHQVIRAYVQVCSSVGGGGCTDFQDSPAGHGTAMCSIALGQPCAGLGGDRGVMGGVARLVFFDISLTSLGTLALPVHIGDLLQTAAKLYIPVTY